MTYARIWAAQSRGSLAGHHVGPRIFQVSRCYAESVDAQGTRRWDVVRFEKIALTHCQWRTGKDIEQPRERMGSLNGTGRRRRLLVVLATIS